MTEARVLIRHGRQARAETLHVRINGRNPTFKLGTDRISASLVASPDNMLLDFLDIAATVSCVDSSIRRGGDTRAGFGAAWHRELNFEIPVRRPEIWTRPDVIAAVADAVSFLTDDVVTFGFTKSEPEAGVQRYLNFDVDAQPALKVDDVILFSGGLDSFAGALKTLCEGSGRVALVTHRSAQKTIPAQTLLADYLIEKFPGRVLHIPVVGRRVGKQASETTQRSRSFLFAALGYAVASILGADRICFFENGIVGHNLPISPQVIGAMATRTTHPLAMRKLRTLFELIGPIPIDTPFEWMTKTDVLELIAKLGARDQIANAVSCVHVREQSKNKTHCGTCSQCLDRRFAVLALGYESDDPGDRYGTEVLTAGRNENRALTLALEWTRHGIWLADMSFGELCERFAGELFRITRGYSGETAEKVAQKVHDLQRRHGQAVRKALEHALKYHAAAMIERRLDKTSLLYLVATGSQEIPTLPDQTEELRQMLIEPEDAHDSDPMTGIFPLQVEFSTRNRRYEMSIRQLGMISGKHVHVAHALREAYEADIDSRLPPKEHQFSATGFLANIMGVNKSTIWQSVKRCRAELSDLYEAVVNEPPQMPLLIESRKPKGYRLDPNCRVIDSTRHPAKSGRSTKAAE